MRKDIRATFWFVIGLAIVALTLPAFAAEPAAWQVGTYEGEWSSVFTPIEIEVVSLDGNRAELVYRWGSNPHANLRPGEDKISATVDGPVLRFNWKQADYTLTIKDGGAVDIKSIGRRGILYGKLKKK